jgi:multiple sugar transport system ATP-binding protein
MNVADCACEVTDGGVRVRLNGMTEPFVLAHAESRTQLLAAPAATEGLAIGVRPEAITMQLAPAPGLLRAKVHLVEPLGAYDIVDFTIGDANLRARTASQLVRGQGDAVWIGLDAGRTQFFDKRSGLSMRQAA